MTHWRRLIPALLIVAVPAFIVWHEPIWWWIEVHTGTVNEPGPYYGFFSGFGSDLTEFGILAGLGHFYWAHTCHEPKCWRPGHTMADGHTRSCWHHNPDGRPKPGHIARKHAEHLRHRQHMEGTPP